MHGFASCVRHFPTWTGSDALMSLSFRSHGKVSTHLTEQVKRLKGSSFTFLILTEHLLGARRWPRYCGHDHELSCVYILVGLHVNGHWLRTSFQSKGPSF